MPPVCPEAPQAEGGTHADVLPDLGGRVARPGVKAGHPVRRGRFVLWEAPGRQSDFQGRLRRGEMGSVRAGGRRPGKGTVQTMPSGGGVWQAVRPPGRAVQATQAAGSRAQVAPLTDRLCLVPPRSVSRPP